MKLTIPKAYADKRLDVSLTELLPDISRSFVQKEIKAGRIVVNEKKVTPHYIVSEGESVEVPETTPKKLALIPNDTVPFTVVAQTKDYIVINKPAGLVMHPAPKHDKPTLADGLIATFPELAGIGEDPLRPGIVHRIDKDVSGLIVIARTQEMFEHLKKQFKERTIYKEYRALVHAKVTRDGTIDLPIGRSKSNSGKMAAHPSFNDGDRPAITEYFVTENIKTWTLLKVVIHTGRTHQIRVHLNALQFPVVGDTMYTNKRIKQKKLGRVFLHAAKLAFDELDGAHVEYDAPLPEELVTFLEELKK